MSMKKAPVGKSKTPTFKIQDYQKQGFSHDEILQAKQAFELFDNNGTGSINPKQLKASMSSLGFQSTSQTLFHAVSQLANSGVNSIDFADFLDLMSARSHGKITKKTSKRVFSLFDDQKTGFISIKNLRKLTKQLGLQLSEVQLQELIEKADHDNDGLVSQEEFYAIMSR